MATATGYVRRENAVLDFCCYDSLFDCDAPFGAVSKMLKDTVVTVFLFVKWGICIFTVAVAFHR